MLHLAPMTEAEYATYIASAARSYADAHLQAGDVSPEEALPRAQKEYDELLPNGLHSRNQFLFSLAHDELGAIGIIWFELRERLGERSAYLYDFEIRETLRGRGFGRRALELLEVKMRELSVRSIALNVFGFNHAARALYEKMGYQVTSVGMKKQLTTSV